MSPLTWDRHTPLAPTRLKTPDPDFEAIDTTQFEAVEPGMDFGEGEGERTVITTASYDLKPKFTGRAAAIVGASLFAASDALIAWNRFVGSTPAASVVIMVTYHLGQLGLVLSLVR